MGAGNLIGLVFNMFVFGAMWTILGGLVDRIITVFNISLKVLPSLQDAANGLSIMQTIWSSLLILMFIALIINYIMNENSQISGGE
jgi:hypothetical protein